MLAGYEPKLHSFRGNIDKRAMLSDVTINFVTEKKKKKEKREKKEEALSTMCFDQTSLKLKIKNHPKMLRNVAILNNFKTLIFYELYLVVS